MKIEGRASDRSITVDGELLNKRDSQAVINHSPDGFMWGYGGSGPSQSALAICLKLFGETEAKKVYQQFKWDFIAKQIMDKDFTIDINPWEWKNKNGSR